MILCAAKRAVITSLSRGSSLKMVRPLAAGTSVDPIQKIYLDKLNEFAAKAKSGTAPPDPVLEAKLSDEKKKLKDIYSRNPYNSEHPDDPTKPPSFSFKDPNLQDIF